MNQKIAKICRSWTKKLSKLADANHAKGRIINKQERSKPSNRTEIINFLLSHRRQEGQATSYLEIGVRNPDDNFHHIQSDEKYSVDPGLEYEKNPVDFKMTSDTFFSQLDQGEILSPSQKFDVIFIDGLHLAEQVDRDITNASNCIKDGGFIVLHDCNPPTEWHAREQYEYELSPASGFWNGTTWKAFVKWRANKEWYSCCVDTDFGIGIISKNHRLGDPLPMPVNPFFEYQVFNENRNRHLNLLSFVELKNRFV